MTVNEQIIESKSDTKLVKVVASNISKTTLCKLKRMKRLV
jgi:hypothetical protein